MATDGSIYVKRNSKAQYLFVTDNCNAIVAKLNEAIGGGRTENGEIIGGAGKLYCKSDAQVRLPSAV